MLPRHKQVAVVNALVEGCSVRATERMVDVSRETVLSLLVRVGEGCAAIMDQTMVNLPCERLELDEIWAFVQKKQRRVSDLDDAASVGDTWTFVALDAETKLVPAYFVGKRNAENTNSFVADLASRLSKHVQISTDGLGLYVAAIHSAFGTNVDYAQIVKSFEAEHAALVGTARLASRRPRSCRSSVSPLRSSCPRPMWSVRT